MAVELEFLGQFEEAISALEKAREISSMQLKGKNLELVKNIVNNIQEIKCKIVNN